MTFAQSPAINYHAVPNLPAIVTATFYNAGKVDTWHQRITANDGSGSSQREAVFIVDGAVVNANEDIVIR